MCSWKSLPKGEKTEIIQPFLISAMQKFYHKLGKIARIFQFTEP